MSAHKLTRPCPFCGEGVFFEIMRSESDASKGAVFLNHTRAVKNPFCLMLNLHIGKLCDLEKHEAAWEGGGK